MKPKITSHKIIKLFAALILLNIKMVTVASSSSTNDPPCFKKHFNSSCAGHDLHTCPYVLARDAITLSMKEVRDTTKYIATIPKLKSVQAISTMELYQCINGLIENLNSVHGALRNLRHLHSATLDIDTNSVNHMILVLQVFEDMCRQALKEVDNTITLMLQRKVVDISLTIHNVVLRVMQFENMSIGSSANDTTKN